jgi:CheY-like chemotaxis protein
MPMTTPVTAITKAADRSTPPATHRPWVLIVEDEPDNRELLAEFLEASGYASRACGSSAEADNLLETSLPPCLVIVDVRLPDVDGPTFVANLRGRPGFAEVPVLFVTGMDVARFGALREPVLNKPLDLDALMAIVERHCGDAGSTCAASG